MNSCSACKKKFKFGDKAVQSNCGHFVHYFKVDCVEKDYCTQCNKVFHISTNSPIVTMYVKGGTVESNDERMNSSRVKESKTCCNECEGCHILYMKKFDEQKKLNLEIIKKINLLANSYQELVNLISEQTSNFKIVVERFTNISNDIKILKNNVEEISERVNDLIDEVYVQEDYCGK